MPANLPPGLPIVPEGPHEPLPFKMSATTSKPPSPMPWTAFRRSLRRPWTTWRCSSKTTTTPRPARDPDTVLLGLYEGVPLTERDSWWDAGSLPDRITIFRQPILDICASREEVIHEVAVTVVHEIAHHFGIDDDRLHELGWG